MNKNEFSSNFQYYTFIFKQQSLTNLSYRKYVVSFVIKSPIMERIISNISDHKYNQCSYYSVLVWDKDYSALIAIILIY